MLQASKAVKQSSKRAEGETPVLPFAAHSSTKMYIHTHTYTHAHTHARTYARIVLTILASNVAKGVVGVWEIVLVVVGCLVLPLEISCAWCSQRVESGIPVQHVCGLVCACCKNQMYREIAAKRAGETNNKIQSVSKSIVSEADKRMCKPTSKGGGRGGERPCGVVVVRHSGAYLRLR